MESKAKVFELDHVFYNYPYEDPVLRDIRLSIHPGERICILGANGSGKSTLLKMLAGLIYPEKGSIKAFGEEFDRKAFSSNDFSRAYHKKVGFIFQNSDTQLFCSTVREEIAFGPLQYGLSVTEVEKRVGEVLNLLGIQHLQDKAPFKLSGGEKKKVAIAATLILNPEVIILDEPTNGLDPRTQRWLVQLLKGLSDSGKTIITSTHNLELVQEISDRAIVFSELHQIVKDGPTEEVLSNVALLNDVNLVDEYYHSHGEGSHTHYHIHNY